MIKIRSNRIVVGCTSMCLPEGMCITNVVEGGDGIVFFAEDFSFSISVISKLSADTHDEKKEDLVGEIKGDDNMDVCALSLNGLKGYYTSYKDSTKEHYEARLKNIINGDARFVYIHITAFLKKTSLTEVLNIPAIKKFFCDLRAE